MRTSEVLNKAADLIEEHGWIKGQGWPGEPYHTGKLCLEGGLLAAMGMVYQDIADDERHDEFRACPAYQAVREYTGHDGSSLWTWNDGRQSAIEVIEVLRGAALVEAARESTTEYVKDQIEEMA